MHLNLNLLALSIPFFLILIYIEHRIYVSKKLEGFKLHNSISNLSVGIAERLCDVFVSGLFFILYDTLQKKWGIFHIKPSVFLWILLLIITDFVWYWYHRLAHEINLLWAVHIVHHQSEDFNFTVSARITVLQALLRGGFWCILPIIGFPAPMIIGMLLLHGLYPFFIHTKLIKNLGLLEYLIVTPSHHRVHHASNDEYLDKNYGDVLIIWDNPFGTFQKERDETTIVYGLTKPLNTYSFLWQHFHFFIELFIALKKEKFWKERIKILYGKPESLNDSIRIEAEQLFRLKKNKDEIVAPLNTYVIWQIGVLLFALFLFILIGENLSLPFTCLFVFQNFITLINCGAIMEQKKWVFNLELARTLSLFIIPAYFANFFVTSFTILIALFAVSVRYKYLERRYLNLVYR